MSTATTNAHEFTVSDLAGAVKRTVEDSFGHVRVRGEISGFRGRHSSGHCYFTLKDDAAAIDAVVWKGQYDRLTFKPEEGLEIIASGRLTTYPRSSKYQIVIDNIEPAGAGALMALLEERRKKLLAEGLFAPERKRELPYLPRVIGVVTSPTGAVIRDILHRLADRFPTHVLVWPVRVQGETSAAEVSAAIRGFNALTPDGPIARPDLLIVARGGGSIEDLWSFNEEAVVRAVADSAIPVITAIGHETDTTLVDYAADRRAPTPTGAAEMAVPVRGELIAYVDDLGQRQRHAARRLLASQRDRFRAAASGLPRATMLVATQRQRLDLASQRLESGLHAAYNTKARAFAEAAGHFGPRLLSRHLDGERLRIAGLAARLNPLVLTRRTDDFARRLIQLADRAPTALANRAQRASIAARPALERLEPAFARALDHKRTRLDAFAKLLDTLSYRRILDRGFALVTAADGTLVRSPADTRPGEILDVTVAGGSFQVQVGSGAPTPPPRKKPREGGEQDTQESLF